MTHAEMSERFRALEWDFARLHEGYPPSAEELEAAPVLEDWSAAPSPGFSLVGQVTGHPLIRPGSARTSHLFYIAPDRSFARTFTRWYRLGASANRRPGHMN